MNIVTHDMVPNLYKNTKYAKKMKKDLQKFSENYKLYLKKFDNYSNRKLIITYFKEEGGHRSTREYQSIHPSGRTNH